MPTVLSSRIPPPRVILDSTLRDGEQSPGVSLTPDEKAEYVTMAESVGIRYIEEGFPQNSFDFEACRAAVKAARYSRLVALALTTEESIGKAAEVGAHEVLLIVPSSHSHLTAVYGAPLETLLEELSHSIDFARRLGLFVNIGLEDASQNDIDVIFKILDRVMKHKESVDCVTVADTRGRLLPKETRSLLRKVQRKLRAVPCRLAFHAHNDLGLATANSLVALQLNPPLDCVHVTTCGVGERAGNASLEQIAILLSMKMNRDEGLDLSKLRELAGLVQKGFLTPVHPHSPIIGAKVFQHESGLHQKGMLNESQAYQFLNPQVVGAHIELILGKHSGGRMRAVIADEAGCSEQDVWELQKSIVNEDKTRIKANFASMLNFLQESVFIGMSQKDAVTALKPKAD